MRDNEQNKRVESFLKKEIFVDTIPKIVDIEPTNLCQFDCKMCSRKNIGRYGEMSLELLEHIMENNRPSFEGQSIWLQLAGEPLLHTNIGKFIKLAKRYIKKAKIITNGVLLKDKAEELIDSGVDEIIVSIDSLRPHEFLDIKRPRIGFELNDLFDNIRYFLKKNQGKIDFKCQFIDFDGMLDEASIVKKMKELGVGEVVIKKLSNRCGKSDMYFEQKNNDACFLPRERIVITHDGRVGVCCHDLTTTLVIGDLKQQTIRDVRNGKEARKLREQMKNGTGSLVCHNCSSKVTQEHVLDYKEREFTFLKI